MSKFSKENLYLLEFLVDKVNLDFCVAQKIRCISGETCVSFQFLDNPPIPICERDFVPKMKNLMEGCGGCGSVKNGKSCLFSLSQEQIPQLKKNFDLKVEVYKKLKDEGDEKTLVGKTQIPLHFMFQDLMTTAITQDATSTKTIKDCYRICSSNPNNKDLVGHISAYVRLSCFGKDIVNKFQMNMKDNTVDFKADEGHYLFKYNKKPPSETTNQPYQRGSPPSSFPQKSYPQKTSQQACCPPSCSPPPCPPPRCPPPQPPCGICPSPQPPQSNQVPPCGNPAPCGPYDPCGGSGQQQLTCCQAKSQPHSAGCPCMVQDAAIQPEKAAKGKGKGKGKKGKKGKK